MRISTLVFFNLMLVVASQETPTESEFSILTIDDTATPFGSDTISSRSMPTSTYPNSEVNVDKSATSTDRISSSPSVNTITSFAGTSQPSIPMLSATKSSVGNGIGTTTSTPNKSGMELLKVTLYAPIICVLLAIIVA
ncbi:hypothetical protein K7432_009699 [Basidiobolus ranarum]|uniref:Uncharacterized protein n=1 Tax=Basidiobolus ranarum TaxID=34480 RepID=A0ABR2VWN9_9FUNG